MARLETVAGQLLRGEDVDAAVWASEAYLKSVKQVHLLSHELANALSDLSGVTQKYADAISHRPTYFRPSGVRTRTGEDVRKVGPQQVQFMCLAQSATMFKRLADVQESLSKALHAEWDQVDSACVLYFEYVIQRNLEYEQEIALLRRQRIGWQARLKSGEQPTAEEQQRRLEELVKDMPEGVEIIRGDPVLMTNVKHFGKLTVKQSRFDLKLARHASTIASLIYAGLADAIHAAGGEDSFAGLERWKPFLESAPPRSLQRRPIGSASPTDDAAAAPIDEGVAEPDSGTTMSQPVDDAVEAAEAAAKDEQVNNWRSAVLSQLAKLRETSVPARKKELPPVIDYDEPAFHELLHASSGASDWRIHPRRDAAGGAGAESKGVRLQRSRHGFLASMRRNRKQAQLTERDARSRSKTRVVSREGPEHEVKEGDTAVAPQIESARGSLVADPAKDLPVAPEEAAAVGEEKEDE